VLFRSQVSHRKVAVVYEADRMNVAAANIFLKTLEEPPASTTILLLTTRPYSLLTTIRSRCLHFRFTYSGAEALAGCEPDLIEKWQSARADYAAWLGKLTEGAADKRAVADQVLSVYGLVTRFSAVLSAATDQAWKQQKEKLPDDLDDDEVDAIQTGITNGIRLKLFAELEHATLQFAQARLATGDEVTRRAVVAAVAQLEHDVGLLRLNLNEAAALENFLLSSLRIWSRR
jgi:DNA polymerase-3 subunit delta'